ncbi:voltage-dependent calcium channel subunit alpha-2/delta-3-like [Tribolium madens]|uniref:voltage-dependent calcium channel subunit alpha-2/delta-3-like n=1 Tax=Tribolium madens TaxID=41895 RepID=UPI001CF73D94|nr:voltage-dependent calcium channel subunit alpha-2/delta-3-like [Tribolium madens]
MMFLQKHFTEFLLLSLFTVTTVQCSKLQEEQVSRWAKKIGDELWKLGEVTTKFKEIQGNYVYLNAQVETKDLENLISEVGKDIERMMDRKSDAIKCIIEEAESLSQYWVYNNSEYKYYSSKYSNVVNESKIDLAELSPALKNNENMYLEMVLNDDTHFYNLPVDTSRSSVHVPTNIFDRHEEAAYAIQWSEKLDEIFVRNYNSDPALSWQYFGSTSGIMRHYPAKKWPDIKKDEFDCRVRTWYIEAATCTKDVIILLDNSGSMDGMGRHIAALTVNTILDTFSNNDYINILYYSNETTNYTIPCFKNLLVQATPENIILFKDAIQEFSPSGKTDFPQALQMAFDILENYREIRKCNNEEVDEEGRSKACNQAIMLITDGISRNFSDIVIRNNQLDGGKTIPVRIFTYLIGKEATNVEEIRWMACANRGFHTQVQTLEQVTSAVLQYINVIARPLVLQAEDHPISWTHAYIDMTYDDKKDDQINEPYRLLTSAAVPAFDKKVNQNNETRVANLLGVAGTDVPIADIEKLTLPYKLGVNAYAFIVSNNGYILMHQDFRPMFEKHLRKNYNSIDLVEVEEFDTELEPRNFHSDLIILRNTIVNGSQGSIHGIPVKYHYDNMRRVTRDKYDYYYVPLNQTPFSLAFAVPDGYGHFSLHVEDEIKNDRHKPGVKITDYFNGSNWKIHPKWVYCKYHYLEGHEYETPEKEILHFLGKVYENDFKWRRQYEVGAGEELTKVECGRRSHSNDDYYCDKDLVQRLVFDAKNTFGAFQGTSWKHDTDQLFRRFNATLRFVATMSGLTRWEYISEEVENNTEREFGDLHSEAIDETWYKSAVIQHRYDPESFVYSVPFNSGLQEDLLVTGSYAVFPTDAGKMAPGCVVGFQFAHKNFMEIVHNITANVSIECTDCGRCSIDLNCYLIDSDGYIIVSENVRNTGKFFGEIEGDIMGSMLDKKIFEKVKIYDYQAVCNTRDDETSDATILLTPLNYVRFLVNWFVMKISWLALEINICNLWAPFYTYAQDEIENKKDKGDDEEDEQEEEDTYYDCEQERDLFFLLHNNKSYDLPGEISGHGFRSYYIKKVPYSNLIFVAINETMERTNKQVYSTSPRKIVYNDSSDYPCQKLDLNNLPRRRLAGCYNEHPLESEIKVCGKTSRMAHHFLVITVMCLFLIQNT